MDRFCVNLKSCFHHALSNCGVRVNRMSDFFKSCFHLNRQSSLINKVCCMRTQNRNTKYFTIFLISNDLNQTFGLINNKSFTTANERKTANLKLTVFVTNTEKYCPGASRT